MGQNLRNLRQQAGISQSRLAELSGLSRRTIAALEAGETNISLASLDRLAEALNVSFSRMVADPQAESRRIRALAWRGQSEESQGTLLASVSAHSETQFWSWALAEGECYDGEADPPGWTEMIFVREGTLRIETETEVLLIPAGDFSLHSSAQKCRYMNSGSGMVRFIRTATV